MTKTTRTIAAAALALILGGAAPPPWGTVANESSPSKGAAPNRPGDKSAGLLLHVVLEEIDLVGKTLTARPFSHVIPPSGSTGGAVYNGCAPPGAKAARYVRLPILPEARLQSKRLRTGMWVTLRLRVVEGGALVVVAAEETREPARVGINYIDAPGPMGNR
jgi:hypothetical protein